MFQDLRAPVTTDDAALDTPQLAPPVTIGARLPAVASFPASAKRWSLCLAVAICFHAIAAAALLASWDAMPEEVANSPVITIELALLPVAPEQKPSDAALGPQESNAQPRSQPVKPVESIEPPQQSKIEQKPEPPKPIAIAELPRQPQAEEQAVIPLPKPPEQPIEEKPRSPQASLASTPAHAERRAARAAAPAPGAPSRDANAVPNWKSLLVATLERNKRYPEEAESRGERGTAELAFNVDRHGRVHHARIMHSSGSGLLDRATLAMLERAAPLPPPPPEIAGAEIPIVVPIRYDVR